MNFIVHLLKFLTLNSAQSPAFARWLMVGVGVASIPVFGASDKSEASFSNSLLSAYFVPTQDDDRDGIINAYDYCPQTDNAFPINQYGCYLDSDGDGYVDQSDRCPNSPYGMPVDHHGCTIDTLIMNNLSTEKAGSNLSQCTLDTTNEVQYHVQLLFAHNASFIDKKYYKNIGVVAEQLRQHPYQFLWIEGHTDSLGEASYNKALSKARAEAVAKVLINQFGVNKSLIGIKSYGEEKPIAGNLLKDGRRKNRRVVVTVETCR